MSQNEKKPLDAEQSGRSKEKRDKASESLEKKLAQISAALDRLHGSLDAHRQKLKEHLKSIQENLSDEDGGELAETLKSVDKRAVDLEKRAGELLLISNAAQMVEELSKNNIIYPNATAESMKLLDAQAVSDKVDLSSVKKQIMDHIAYKAWEDSGKKNNEKKNWEVATQVMNKIQWDKKVKPASVVEHEDEEEFVDGNLSAMMPNEDGESAGMDLHAETDRLQKHELPFERKQASVEAEAELPKQKQAKTEKKERVKKEVVDIPEKIFKELIGSGAIGAELVQKLIFAKEGDKATTEMLDRLFDNVPPETRASLEKLLQKQGYDSLQDFIDTKWKGGLAESVGDTLRHTIQADLRKKGVENLSLFDKAKVHWKSIAFGLVPVLAVGVAGGVVGAAALGTWGAVSVGMAAAGSYGKFSRDQGTKNKNTTKEPGRIGKAFSKFKKWFVGDPQKDLEDAIDRKVFTSENFQETTAEALAADLGNDRTLSLLLSQTVRESTSNNAQSVNQEVLLEQVADQLRADGEIDLANDAESEALISQLVEMSKSPDGEVQKLLAEFKKSPVWARALIRLQEARGGKVFTDSDSKLKKLFEYGLIAGGAATVATLYTSSGSALARMGLSGFAFGVAGYKYGESLDVKEQEKQMETATKEMSQELQEMIDRYKEAVPPSEMAPDELAALSEQVASLKGNLKVLAEIRGGGSKSVVESVAEGIVREADRVLFEAKSLGDLKTMLHAQNEQIEKSATGNLQKMFKKTGKWRRLGWGAAGAVAGAAFGWAMGEWAEIRAENKLDTALDQMRLSPEQKLVVLNHLAERPVNSAADLDLDELQKIMEHLAPKGRAVDQEALLKEVQAAFREEAAKHTLDASVEAPPVLDVKLVSLENFGLRPEQTKLLLPEQVDYLNEKFSSWEKVGLSTAAIKAFTEHGFNRDSVVQLDKIIVATQGDKDALRAIDSMLVDNHGDTKLVLENMLVAKDMSHNSVTALLVKQLESDPEKFGYKSTSGMSVETWAKRTAGQIAVEAGMVKGGGVSTGLVFDKNHDSFVMLTQGKDGLGVKVVSQTMDVGGRKIPEAVPEVVPENTHPEYGDALIEERQKQAFEQQMDMMDGGASHRQEVSAGGHMSKQDRMMAGLHEDNTERVIDTKLEVGRMSVPKQAIINGNEYTETRIEVGGEENDVVVLYDAHTGERTGWHSVGDDTIHKEPPYGKKDWPGNLNEKMMPWEKYVKIKSLADGSVRELFAASGLTSGDKGSNDFAFVDKPPVNSNGVEAYEFVDKATGRKIYIAGFDLSGSQRYYVYDAHGKLFGNVTMYGEGEPSNVFHDHLPGGLNKNIPKNINTPFTELERTNAAEEAKIDKALESSSEAASHFNSPKPAVAETLRATRLSKNAAIDEQVAKGLSELNAVNSQELRAVGHNTDLAAEMVGKAKVRGVTMNDNFKPASDSRVFDRVQTSQEFDVDHPLVSGAEKLRQANVGHEAEYWTKATNLQGREAKESVDAFAKNLEQSSSTEDEDYSDENFASKHEMTLKPREWQHKSTVLPETDETSLAVPRPFFDDSVLKVKIDSEDFGDVKKEMLRLPKSSLYPVGLKDPKMRLEFDKNVLDLAKRIHAGNANLKSLDSLADKFGVTVKKLFTKELLKSVGENTRK